MMCPRFAVQVPFMKWGSISTTFTLRFVVFLIGEPIGGFAADHTAADHDDVFRIAKQRFIQQEIGGFYMLDFLKP